MYFCLFLPLYTVLTGGQISTRVRELDINAALDGENTVVLTNLNVYRDELVLLDTYGGVISVNADSLSIENSLFDTFNLTHVYSTVNDATGMMALCTNKKGRCQYMDVATLSVLGFVDGLILEGEQGEEVDQRVLILLANTTTNVLSLFTASGNAVTIGQTNENPMYPIRTAQLREPLSLDALFIANSVSGSFDRKYISAFKSGGFVYFLSEDSPNIRVTRICESDSLLEDRFHSLYQVILTPCDYASYVNVLDARLVILNTVTEQEYVIVTYQYSNIISVCAYTVSSINQAMRSVYESCVVNRVGSIPNEQIFHLPISELCSVYSNPSINTECNLWTIVGGSSTLRVFLDGSVTGGTKIVSYFTPTRRTAVLTTRIEDSGYCYYYLYLVQDNVIIKYLMNGLSLIFPQLERLTFSDSLTAIETDQSGYRLFAISNIRLFVIPVIDCERHLSCANCVSDRDPMCGWCSVQNVCSIRSQCENYNLSYRWIDDDNTKCFDAFGLFPNTSFFNINTNVTIFASNLPELSAIESYECVFSSKFANYRTEIISVNGDINKIRGPINGTANLTCQVPIWMSSFIESDNRVYNISVGTNKFNNTLSPILAFTIIQCEFNTDCFSCISSDVPCGWCLYDSLCVSQSDMCVLEEWIQLTESTILCPKIDSYFNSSSVQISAVEGSNITLQGSHLPSPTLVYKYTCVLNGTIHVAGMWKNISAGNVQICCLIPEYSFMKEGVSILQLIWGPTLYPIKQGILEFGVYICGNQLDCQNCLSNNDCKWCATSDNRTGVCASMCSNDMITFTSVQTCSHQEITDFAPRSTAIGGAVILEVNGFNLVVQGRETIVSIGDTKCTVFLVNQTQIRCFLQTPNQILNFRINVTVDGVSVESDYIFDTRKPNITVVSPNFTPQSGGSNVTLLGKNLLVGLNRKITAGETELVIIETISKYMSDDKIVCISGQSSSISSPLISITIDTVQTTFTQEEFSLLSDPQVTNIYLSGYDIELRSTIVSGGLDYRLRGRNLGASLTQTLVFMLGDKEISRSNCIPPLNARTTELVCPGEKFINIAPSYEGTDVRFELIMDSVPNVTSLYFQVFEFKLYPDPVLTEGINSTIAIDDDVTEILIEISNVNTIPSQAILIRGILSGNITNVNICSSSRFTTRGIVCSINSTQIYEIMELEVEIGLNGNKYSLRLSVEIVSASRIGLTSLIISGLILCMILLVIICAISAVTGVCSYGCFKYRRNRNMAKYLLLEVNTVEKALVDNWVKGFAEMNAKDEVDDELFKVGNVPLHEFKTFVMRILFSGLQDHPVLHPIEKPLHLDTKAFNTGLHEFEQLLHDKRFLLVMIHSMEDNPNFSTLDRRNVASLLTIALFNSMPYLTEILFDLLREVINKMISKNSPKLLFTGTPSVAERLLTDWLAFNLYSHLQCAPSIAIYELFLRLKRHIESGPVDILNARAINSLSEEKLLRQEIPYTKLDIEIEATKNNIIPCTLLDCDTITQAKIKVMDKLHHGTGFYQRPKLEDVDLMLRLEGRHRQLLRDNDMTNEEDEQWRKINTLSHYNIQNGMLFVVVPRKPKPNPGQVWDYPGASIYDFRDVQSASQLLTLHDTQMSKVYHLQKSEQCEDKMKVKKRVNRRRDFRTEVFLPRLLATKAVLQKYVDQLMEEIFPNEANQIPRAIKLLFDFFDELRTVYSIEDPDVVHNWKSNSVTLMFWVNILKNPDFLLDVAKGATLDAALSVIAQAVIDSCSPELHVTKDSPTNKLLYNKDVQIYKTRVYKYYEEIRHAPTVQVNSISFPMNLIQARGQDCMFHVDSAVYGLFSYAQSYQEEIRNRLDIENLELQKEIFNEVCLALT